MPWPGGAGSGSSSATERATEASDEELLRATRPEVISGPGLERPAAGGADLTGSSAAMVVGAYERLGSRLLSRLRDLRDDLEADLGEIRSEIADLRTSLDEVTDRMQLRQVRSSIDELRGDVAGLRRALSDRPELPVSGDDVRALPTGAAAPLQGAESLEPVIHALGRALAERMDGRLDALDARLGATDATVNRALTGLVSIAHDLDALREDVASSGTVEPTVVSTEGSTAGAELAEELTALREEMVALRRRISLKAAGSTLTPEEVSVIAEAVTERLLKSFRPAS